MTPPVSMESNLLDGGLDEALTHEIFSILENKFLFGYPKDVISTTPPKLVSSSSGTTGRVRILSIDAAGSTDGVLAAKALLHLQTILRRKSGNPTAHISEFFDVVSGAGAGGILAALLFTPGKDGAPLFTAEDSVKFIADNARKSNSRGGCLFKRGAYRPTKALNKVFGEMTLRDTLKAVLIPCYDLNTGAPFLFSRADALEMDGCDFKMAAVCGATAAAATRPVELKSTDGTTKVMALGGGMAMSNPTAAAVTHVLNNKQEFPLCKGVEDLLVVSLGNGDSNFPAANMMSSPASLVRIAGDGAADMVDQAVSMAFGESRRNNYFRIQGNGILAGKSGRTNNTEKKRNVILSIADEMLGQKNVESVLFQGRKLVDDTNMEKLETLGGELIKEQERRKNSSLPTVVLKKSIYSPRSSSATTLSTISSI